MELIKTDDLTIDMVIDMCRYIGKVKDERIMADNPLLNKFRDKYTHKYNIDEDIFLDHYMAITREYFKT